MKGARPGLVLLVLIAGLLTGCGEGSGEETVAARVETTAEVREVVVALDGWENAETVGLVMADGQGHFAEEGLFASTLSPTSPTLSIRNVVAGADHFGVAHEPEVMLARERGAPIMIVGSLISQPTAAMIWLEDSQIGGIADLKGKVIAIPGLSFQRAFLETVLAQGGLAPGDVQVKRVGNDLVPALVSGRADAIFGGSWNLEGAELETRGLAPVITRVQDLGVPDYDELVLVARSDLVSDDPQLVRDFTSAVARGTAAAIEDPAGAADEIEAAVESNPDLNRKETLAEVEATVPLLSKTGYVDPGRMDGLVSWMLEEGMIRQAQPVEQLLTNDFARRAP